MHRLPYPKVRMSRMEMASGQSLMPQYTFFFFLKDSTARRTYCVAGAQVSMVTPCMSISYDYREYQDFRRTQQ